MSAISEAFQVVVVFSAVDHLTGPMSRMAGQMGLCSAQTEALQNKLNGFKNMAFVGGAITAFGAVMAGGLKHAVDAAGELQSSLMGVRQSLGLTQTQFRNMQNMVMTEGIKTAFSAAQMGQLAEGMVGGGMGKVLTASLDPKSEARKVLQEYIAYADVRYLSSSHEAPRESVATASQMAHSYGVYDMQGTRKFLNTLNAALASYHGTSSEFNTQFGYYSGTAKTMGMSMEDAIKTEAFMGRMGLGAGRGGTNINQFLQKTLPNGQKKHDRAMQEAGFLDSKGHSVFFDGNKFAGWERASAALQKFDKNFKDIATKNRLLTSVFGEFGKRVAFKVMDKGSMDQLHNVSTEMSKVASITKQQEERNKSWDGQMKQLGSTVHDVVIQFGLGLMPIAQKLAGKMNEIAAATLEWTIHNPKLVETAAAWASWATAVALTVGPLLVIRGVMGYLFASGILLKGVKLLALAMRGLFGWQTVAMGAAYLLWRTYQAGMTKVEEDEADKRLDRFREGNRHRATSIKQLSALAEMYGAKDAKISIGSTNQVNNAIVASSRMRSGAFEEMVRATRGHVETTKRAFVLPPIVPPSMGRIATEAEISATAWSEIWTDNSNQVTEAFKRHGLAFHKVGSDVERDLKALGIAVAETMAVICGWYDKASDAIARFSIAGILGGRTKGADFPASTLDMSKPLKPGDLMKDYMKRSQEWRGTSVDPTAPGPSWWNVPNLPPTFANGTNFAPGGWSMVGERGPELVNLPRGSQVIPNHKLGGGGGVHVENLIIHQQPGQSPRELAQEVMRQIGILGRNRSYASPNAAVPAW